MKPYLRLLLLFAFCVVPPVFAQQNSPDETPKNSENTGQTLHSRSQKLEAPSIMVNETMLMQQSDMDMSPHMKMTSLRDLQPGDRERANRLIDAARAFAEKYTDYRTALADGFHIFMPEMPQKEYHFTNYQYALEARVRFDATHPTSLLYERQSDGYKLVGVMYTAPPNATEDQLNARVPLSIARWHAHVNLCLPPAKQGQEKRGTDSRLGAFRSIANQQDCDAAGGTFMPQLFGWMVHVYPFEQDRADIWSTTRQHQPTK